MLKRYHKKGFRLDSRLPILAAPELQGSPYQICQFQAMCSLAFYAFWRLGEITSIPSQASTPPLQLYKITRLLSATGDLVSYKVSFGKYKHQYMYNGWVITYQILVFNSTFISHKALWFFPLPLLGPQLSYRCGLTCCRAGFR